MKETGIVFPLGFMATMTFCCLSESGKKRGKCKFWLKYLFKTRL